MNIRSLFGRARRDEELDEEIQAHLAMAVRDRIERGESPQSAEVAARKEFGNRALIQETTREMWGWNWTASLRQELRYALRGMRRSPGFTAVAVLSLALGIGANTAIFSLIDSLMLRTLPVEHPEQLIQPSERFQDEPRFNTFSWNTYQHFVAHNHVLSGLIGTATANWDFGPFFNVRTGSQAAERVQGVYVTGSFFPMLGVQSALGRLIRPDDDRVDAPAAVAVVSWSYWKDRLNLDPSILGRRVAVDGVPVAIIGVAARGFRGLNIDYPEDIWVPLALQPVVSPKNSIFRSHGGPLALAGRLKPGVSIGQARAEMAVLFRHAIEADPQNRAKALLAGMKFEMESASAGLSRARDDFARPLVVLMVAVGLLLLIACTNVAGMLLARGAARQRELALRVSLGAGGWRLARQSLTESMLLALAGTLVGVWLAWFATSALVKIVASSRDRLPVHVVPNLRVLLFTAGLAVVTGLLFGAVPAFRAWRSAPASSLRETGRGGETRFRRLFGKGLVVAQVALSVGLLSAAGLFMRHLSNIYANLGFERDHVLLVILDPSPSGLSRAQLSRPYQELLERLQTIPRVRSVTLSATTPTSGLGANRDATVEGYQDKPGELRVLGYNVVAPRYFETFGTPLLAGRDFTFADEGGPRVAIINQAVARHYFGDASPLGKHVRFDGDNKPYEIVGVVGDAKYNFAREMNPRIIYFNAFQEARIFSHFSLRTRGAPAAVAGDVRRMVNEVLKNVTVKKMTTLADQVDATIVPERLIVTLSAVFGALGSLLAAIGTYGLLAYSVTRRINEIGIRMALGATQGGIAKMVLREATGITCGGLLIGVLVAYGAKRLAASLIPDLPAESLSPIVFGAGMMIAIALFAAYLPARRAARVDPIETLWYE